MGHTTVAVVAPDSSADSGTAAVVAAGSGTEGGEGGRAQIGTAVAASTMDGEEMRADIGTAVVVSAGSGAEVGEEMPAAVVAPGSGTKVDEELRTDSDSCSDMEAARQMWAARRAKFERVERAVPLKEAQDNQSRMHLGKIAELKSEVLKKRAADGDCLAGLEPREQARLRIKRTVE